jgi:ABC-2 type transport system permease protein
MISLIAAEFVKLRRTPVLWFAVALPALHALLSFAQVADLPIPPGLRVWLPKVLTFWAALVLPFLIALAAGAVAGAEHRNNAWRYLLVTPRARWAIYLAKLLTVVMAAGVAALAQVVWSLAAAYMLSLVNPRVVDLPFTAVSADETRNAGLVFLASLAQISIVWWLSVRVQMMAAPFLAAIAGIGIGLPFWDSRHQALFHINPWEFAPGMMAGFGLQPQKGLILQVAMATALVVTVLGAVDFARVKRHP